MILLQIHSKWGVESLNLGLMYRCEYTDATPAGEDEEEGPYPARPARFEIVFVTGSILRTRSWHSEAAQTIAEAVTKATSDTVFLP